MATKWPDNWHRLQCPKGHGLQFYEEIHNGDLYCVCDVCKTPCAFRNLPIDTDPPPHRIPLPLDDGIKLVNPPLPPTMITLYDNEGRPADIVQFPPQ